MNSPGDTGPRTGGASASAPRARRVAARRGRRSAGTRGRTGRCRPPRAARSRSPSRAIACARIGASNSSMRPRPRALARYIAASASREQPLGACRGPALATPNLAVTYGSPSRARAARRARGEPLGDGRARARRRPAPRTARRTRRRRSGRPCRSPARAAASRGATARSSSSPAWWPIESLISLNWSRSAMHRDRVAAGERGLEPVDEQVRLGSPVIGSCSARWASASRSRSCCGDIPVLHEQIGLPGLRRDDVADTATQTISPSGGGIASGPRRTRLRASTTRPLVEDPVFRCGDRPERLADQLRRRSARASDRAPRSPPATAASVETNAAPTASP